MILSIDNNKKWVWVLLALFWIWCQWNPGFIRGRRWAIFRPTDFYHPFYEMRRYCWKKAILYDGKRNSTN